MPVPVLSALEAQEGAAAEKAVAVRTRLPQYLVSALLAGAFVGIAVVLLLSVSAPMVAAGSSGAKLTQGAVFGVALTLVVFAGGELFTGVVMVVVQGLVRRTVRPAEALAALVASWVGNLVGSVGFAKLVDASGVLSAGAPKGKTTAQLALLAGIVKTKSSLTGSQLLLRAVLCNFLVCLGLWMAARASSDAAKLICLWWALLAFIASGFEHCVANMTVFALAVFAHVPGATAGEMGRNLLLTTTGNVIGGGLLVGLAYSYVGSAGRTVTPPSSEDSPYPVDVVDRVPITELPPVELPAPAAAAPAPRKPAATPRPSRAKAAAAPLLEAPEPTAAEKARAARHAATRGAQAARRAAAKQPAASPARTRSTTPPARA